MASKENNNAMANGTALESYQKLIQSLISDNKKLSDENHSLHSKMASYDKKLSLIREWITKFTELSDHLKEISKDWEPVENALTPVAKLNVDPRPAALANLRILLSRSKLTQQRKPNTPTDILQKSMMDRLRKNMQDDNAVKASISTPIIAENVLDVEIKTEKVDDEDEEVVAPVPFKPVMVKKPFNAMNVSVEPTKKPNETVAKKFKAPEQPKARRTRSMSKISNDEEPSEKRFCLVTLEPVLKSNIDGNGSRFLRSKSDGDKSTIKRVLPKRFSKQ